MFKNRGGLFSGLWRPKNPHSLEHLKYLYSVLYKNQTVTESNRSLLVETLRSIAEILIWGDQNDSTVFDFFLERNMLSFFLKIMNQKCGSYVCVQLLQTLNILFENIRNETSIYYLLSNNHVNSIIVHKFDFSDEEVMAYYISFLKTLSFRLNKHTIHFFYNEHTNDFPLYTEAIKFFNHSESMVRIAVRTLTLNVYRVEEDSMLKFVIDKTAVPYFANLVWFIGNHILEIDACVKNDADHRSLGRLKDLVAEHLDHLHYLNDILNLEIENLNQVLKDHLLSRLFIPLYIFSLVRKSKTDSVEDLKPHVSKVTALFLLCQVFLIITHKPLVRLLAWIIYSCDKEIFTELGAARLLLSDSSTDEYFEINEKVASGRFKPSFVAPALPLDKSLREQMRKQESKTKSKSKSKRKSADKDIRHVEQEANESQIRSSTSTMSSACNADLKELSITDEEKERLKLCEESETTKAKNFPEFTLEARPFLKSIFESLDSTETDYLVLFSLSLLHTIHKNEGMLESILSTQENSCDLRSHKAYNESLLEKLLKILAETCQYGSRIRLVTLDVTTHLIREISAQEISDLHYAQIEDIKEESTLMLRNFYKSEEIFLDMFEDEYREAKKPYLTRMEFLLSDASLLLPPTNTPLTGIDFPKRLPCGEVERARHSIRTFFRMRQLSLDIQGKPEMQLPLSNPDKLIQVQDVLDLNNSDLLAVTVSPCGTAKDSGISPTPKHRRFLVVDVYQIVLVEPDATKLGWGVATFVGFLQDLDVVTDKDDSRCLHVTVHSPGGGSSYGESELNKSRTRSAAPLLSATFTFDDHIRCMAAKQRLTKGRIKARQRKMHQIARLLEMPGNIAPSCPSPPTFYLPQLRMNAASQRRSRSGNSTTGTSNQNFNVSTASFEDAKKYKPLFNATGKVPGGASLLRAQDAASLGRTQSRSRSTTPESARNEEPHDEPTAEGAQSSWSAGANRRHVAATKLQSQDWRVTASPGRNTFSSETGSPSSASFLKRNFSSSTRLTKTDSNDIPLEEYGIAKSDDEDVPDY